MSLLKITDKKVKISLSDAQATVGGYVQVVRCPDGTKLLVNEEGRLYRLPLNEEATKLAGQPIVGNAIHFAKGCGRNFG